MTLPLVRDAMAAALAAGCGMIAPLAAAGDRAAPGPPDSVVVVSGTPIEHDSFDLAAAIDVVGAARIHDAQPRVNASEALGAVPGLIVQNRQNYAQDLQISSRGYGARAAFGVRGIRLIADGIPATMPDGQGQAATFNLDMAERIEVLRGPFSALYSNHAGGVVRLFTRDGSATPSLQVSTIGGSDGTRKVDLNAQGQAGRVGYVIDTSRFETDGYRAHSAARRDQAFAKLTMAPSDASRLTLSASSLHQDGTEDPLGVTWATYRRDRRAGEIDNTDPATPKRTFADRYDTRKNIDHQQIGIAFEQRIGDHRLGIMVYGGNRQVTQFQAFSPAFQAAAGHPGGVVAFERDFGGTDVNWTDVRGMGGGTLSTTLGIDYGKSTDERQGMENFIGTRLGVTGRLRRSETESLSSVAPYAQAEWSGGPWALTAGARHTRLTVDVDDHFLDNGNDSGAIGYSHTTPVLGALYKISPTLNVYASAARGFEAPTLNELFYSGSGSGFNFKLRAATSTNVEAGVKTAIGDAVRLNAALFRVRTEAELVVDTSTAGRTSYRNAATTSRDGAEVSLDASLSGGFRARLALTALHATYGTRFGAVSAGSRLPGVPSSNLYGELAWRDAGDRFGAGVETIASGKIYPEDSNKERPAPGYGIANTWFQARQASTRWRFSEFVRLNNVTGHSYIGSVIVGDTNKRYYEAAPRRTWLVGGNALYLF